MGTCNARIFFFTVCTLQLISLVERQIFDFLGYLWVPILANFFAIIFVIFGFFGGYQFRFLYLILYGIWNVFWLGWNVFLICFYLSIGLLSKDSDILNVGTGGVSWWESNGFGCHPTFNPNASYIEEPSRLPRPYIVIGCILDYQYVEVIHSGLQLFLTIMAILSCILVLRLRRFQEEPSTLKRKKRSTSLYSVEYSVQRDRLSTPEPDLELNQIAGNAHEMGAVGATGLDPNRPMTPRKVKRRSISRGSGRQSIHSTQSRNSRKSHRSSGKFGQVNGAYTGTIPRSTHGVDNVRESQRRKPRYVNPVTRLIDQGLDSSTSTESAAHITRYPANSHHNGVMQSGVSRSSEAINSTGHSNPLYQSSRPSSVYSVSTNVEMDYRPPSAHSSYSNWHGQRPAVVMNGGDYNTGTTTLTANTFGVPQHSMPNQTYGQNPNAVGQVASASGYSRSAASHNGVAGPGRPPYVFGLNSETVI